MAGSHAAKTFSPIPWLLGVGLAIVVIAGLVVGGFVLSNRSAS